ncbi:hypothetical protein FRC03_001547 [Tulasnella sp. 419]|nr:hypothetical protein FRC03_001547 [Tulasnella sp. 419]
MIRLSLPNGRIELVHPPPPEDDQAVVEISTHPLILQRLPFWSKHQTVEEAAKRRETRTSDPQHYRDFRVHPHPRLGPTDLPPVMGSAGFLDIDILNDVSQLGIVLHPHIHRAGYATEILLLLFDHGFASVESGGMGLNRIYLTTAYENVQMRGWLENVLGLKLEGVFKEAWKHRERGEYVDAVGYAILKREWEACGRDRVVKKLNKFLENGDSSTNRQ